MQLVIKVPSTRPASKQFDKSRNACLAAGDAASNASFKHLASRALWTMTFQSTSAPQKAHNDCISSAHCTRIRGEASTSAVSPDRMAEVVTSAWPLPVMDWMQTRDPAGTRAFAARPTAADTKLSDMSGPTTPVEHQPPRGCRLLITLIITSSG